MTDGNFDLWGNEVAETHGQRGRPPHMPNNKIRNKIKLLLALGWSNERIMSALEIKKTSFHKFYKAILRTRYEQRDRLDARRFEIAMDQANGGNITALRELGKMIEKSDMMRAASTFKGEIPNDTKAPAKLGKKAAAIDAAKTAGEGTDWQDDLKFTGGTN